MHDKSRDCNLLNINIIIHLHRTTDRRGDARLEECIVHAVSDAELEKKD